MSRNAAPNRNESPVWISRPVLNVLDLYRWGVAAGIQKMMPPDSIHYTQATVRTPVAWRDLPLDGRTLTIPVGPKPVEIFAYTIKALTFREQWALDRHEELLAIFPMIDHARLRPHVSLYKGGRMPRIPYEGEIVLGPERALPFSADNALGIKHVRIADHV